MPDGSHNVDFSSVRVAEAYDNLLVPVLFEPWADALVEHVRPQPGACVVDLASGTGIVARKVIDRVGPAGSVIAVDISAEMLSLAKDRCGGECSNVRFVQSPASPLDLDSDVADLVYCQQGFQFFPDKREAAEEMFRVTKPGGRVLVTTWSSIEQCVFFHVIAQVLRQKGHDDLADIQAKPFNRPPPDELRSHFARAGFEDVAVETQTLDLKFPGGVGQAYHTVYGTPVGPGLRALPDPQRRAFKVEIIKVFESMTHDGVTSGPMASNVLTATKPL